MGSIMPNTATAGSDEEDSVPEGHVLIGSATSEINDIKRWYDEDNIEGMDAADAWRRHDLVTEWYKWCDRTYPGTKEHDWPDIASAAGEDVDIRLLTRGHSIAGYAILLFLEACYAVDKALCGTDKEALAKVKLWHMPQEMRAYKYLLSDEMILWWATELAELENEIKSPFSSRVSLSWRIKDLSGCLARLEVVMECRSGIGTNIWTTMEEENGSEPPCGVGDAIYGRVERLKTSVEILRKTLKRCEQGDGVASDILPSASPRSVESGIRRRIPRAASPSTQEHDLRVVQTSDTNEENVTPASDVASSVRIDSLLGARLPIFGLQILQSMFKLAMRRFKMSMIRYKANGILAWLTHKETALVLSLCFVVTSVFVMAYSVNLANSQSTTSGQHDVVSDPNFWGNLSQSILSNMSIYLMIAIAVHNRSVGLRYQSWFWLCLFVSFLSSGVGLGLYSAIPVGSMIFLWVAPFAQVVIPVLLITKTGESETGIEDDVERHGD